MPPGAEVESEVAPAPKAPRPWVQGHYINNKNVPQTVRDMRVNGFHLAPSVVKYVDATILKMMGK